VGIADWDPAAATSFDQLVAEGDAAMYREKRRRRRQAKDRALPTGES
jgi:GGDEF domain-containing protein